MGIEVYLKWHGMKTDDCWNEEFDLEGQGGYLRESYHGGPYATRIFVPEGWEEKEPAIPAATLRHRLPLAVLVATYRHHVLYEQPEEGPIASFNSFEDLRKAGINVFANVIGDVKKSTDDIVKQIRPAQIEKARELIAQAKDQFPDYCQCFIKFVELAEAKEKEFGQPCTVWVSY